MVLSNIILGGSFFNRAYKVIATSDNVVLSSHGCDVLTLHKHMKTVVLGSINYLLIRFLDQYLSEMENL